jgi:hypothetical protein
LCVLVLRSGFFQPWLLAHHATPKIQGSTMIFVKNNSREAYRLNESKYC